MFNMSKKLFGYHNEGDIYPTVVKAHQAISKYCDENGDSYTFTGDDEAVINGKLYEIYRGYESGSRGNYGIKCREKVNLSGLVVYLIMAYSKPPERSRPFPTAYFILRCKHTNDL